MCSRSPALAGTTCGRSGRGACRGSEPPTPGQLRHISLDVDGEECSAATRGCLELVAAIERAARYLALGTVTLVNLFDLELVVLAGHGFAHAGERYVSAVRRELASRSFARDEPRHGGAALAHRDDVGAVGAASIVLHSQFAPQMLDLRSRAGDHPWRVR